MLTSSIFEHVTMAPCIVGNILTKGEIVSAMNDKTTLIGLPNDIFG